MTLLKNYGFVKMNLMKRSDLTVREKMVHVLIAVKQGTTDHAKITNRQIADALDISIQYAGATVKKLLKIRLLKKVKTKGHLSITNYVTKNKQYGSVERDMLTTTNLSLQAKYLYTIYCVVGNLYDTNIWSRDSICSQFNIGKDTYHKAHSELIQKGVLVTQAAACGNGIQTSNYNTICRAENYMIIKPDSWLPKKYSGVDLKSAGSNVNFEKVVTSLKEPIIKAQRRTMNETGQPERKRQDKLGETEKDTDMNETGQRIVTSNSNLLIGTERALTGLTNAEQRGDHLGYESAVSYIIFYLEEKLGSMYDFPEEYEAQGVFDILHELAQEYSMKKLPWVMSEEDEKYLDRIVYCWGQLDRIPQLIAEGIMNCVKNEDWRFGQIIYRAHTAVVTYEMEGYAD